MLAAERKGETMADNLVIETTSLTKRYGKIVAVDGLSMEVPRGHVFGLLGPNGSGKTTTMSMLLGLVRPTAGSFSLFGAPTHHRKHAASGRRDHRDARFLSVPLRAPESGLLPGHLGRGHAPRS